MNDTCNHPFHVHSDAAKRMADIVMQAWTDDGWDSVGKWMGFNLGTGDSDKELYARKQDCIRHNSEFKHCFIRLHPAGMSACEAEIMLKFHRDASNTGFRLADPEKKSGGPDIIPRITREGMLAQLQAFQNAN